MSGWSLLVDVLDWIRIELNYSVLRTREELLKEILENLRYALLLERRSNEGFKFSHDRIQSGAYLLLGDEGEAIHFRIGMMLLLRRYEQRDLTRNDDEWMLFVSAHQINHGLKHISGSDERGQILLLNLQAAKQAMKSSAFLPASSYMASAIKLNGANWEDYDLSLDIYDTAVMAAFGGGDIQACQQYANVVLQQATSIEDKTDVYITLIQVHTSLNEVILALDVAYECLADLNVKMRRRPNLVHLVREYFQVKRSLSSYTTDKLLSLSRTTDNRALASKVLEIAAKAAFDSGDSPHFPLIGLQLVKLPFMYGLTTQSPFGFTAFAIILCGPLRNRTEGYKWGTVAQQLHAKISGGKLYRAPRTVVPHPAFALHFKQLNHSFLESMMHINMA